MSHEVGAEPSSGGTVTLEDTSTHVQYVEDSKGEKGMRQKLPRPEVNEKCPRCSSPETKFCYYNNYNIKQPRFYCKVGRDSFADVHYNAKIQ